MPKVGEAYYDFTANTKQLDAALTKSDAQMSQLGDRFKAQGEQSQKAIGGMGKSANNASMAFKKMFATIGGLALVTKVLKDATKNASELEEATNKFNVVFAAVPEQAKEVARELQTAYGMAKSESLELLSNTGDLLTGMGMTDAQALELSSTVQKLSVDLVSFSNYQGGVTGASEVLTKALLGERDALVGLNVKISETDLQARLASEGMANLTGAALMQAKADMTLTMIKEQSAKAMGDFARSGNSWANISRVMAARAKDLSAELGQKFLPALADLGAAFLDASEDGGVLSTVISGIGTAVKKLIQFITFLVRGVQTSFANIKRAFYEAYKFINDTIVENEIGTTEMIEKAKKRQVEIEKSLLKARENSAKATEKLNVSFDKLLGTYDEGEKKTQKFTSATNENSKAKDKNAKASKNQFEALQDGLSAMSGMVDAASSLDTNIAGKFTSIAGNYKKMAENMSSSSAMIATGISMVVATASTAAGMISEQMTMQSEQAIEKMEMFREFALGFLEAERERQLESIGEGQDSEREKNKKELQDLKKQYKVVTNEKKKQKIAEMIAEKKKKEEELRIEDEHNKKKIQTEMLFNLMIAQQRRKAFEQEKQMKIVEATISTISGSLQAFVSAMGLIYPANLIAGGIAAGIVAAFGAAQIAMIASQSPPPMFAEGGIATGPSIFGEKGKEMATPLEGAEGRKAIGFIADEIAGRLSMGEKETAPTATIIDEEASPVTGESGDLIMKGDVYLDGDLVGEWIGKGTKDGNIKINSRAIVS